MMPRKCELRLGLSECQAGPGSGGLWIPYPLFNSTSQVHQQGFLEPPSDAVTKSHGKIDFDTQCILAYHKL